MGIIRTRFAAVMRQAVHFIPILTTLFSAYFTYVLYVHYTRRHKANHILWWLFGVVAYGAGTFTESLITLFGWNEPLFKSWYILGALLGGAPLAQGTVYLTYSKRLAHATSVLLVLTILVASVCVMISPVLYDLVETYRPTGKVLAWQWVRSFSPFINIYAFLFLVGGAIHSAWRYYHEAYNKNRFWGNVCIALGALLPGIGGSFTRFGYTEVLYVTELLGILTIYLGYRIIKQDKQKSIHANQQLV